MKSWGAGTTTNTKLLITRRILLHRCFLDCRWKAQGLWHYFHLQFASKKILVVCNSRHVAVTPGASTIVKSTTKVFVGLSSLLSGSFPSGLPPQRERNSSHKSSHYAILWQQAVSSFFFSFIILLFVSCHFGTPQPLQRRLRPCLQEECCVAWLFIIYHN